MDISTQIWGASKVEFTLTLKCACGADAIFFMKDIGVSYTLLEARERGWRFNDVGDRCICPKCGPKKIPEVYKNVRVSDSPRVVRRVSGKAGKQAEEKVRSPRRVRGR